MKTERIQAFSDGVLAIILTIMVLDLKAPKGHEWHDLAAMWPKFLVYAVSFIYVGIYWNNHHHVFQAARKVNGSVLWANLGLLFALSIFPVATGWVGDTHFAAVPMSFYAAVALASALTYTVLVHRLIRCDSANSLLAEATRSGTKEKVSLPACIGGIIAPFFGSTGVVISGSLLLSSALMWIIPDRRIERVLARAASGEDQD